MKPLTGKEAAYLADAMANEDLLIKQCIAASQSQNPAVQLMCKELIIKHQEHYGMLLNLMEQHTSIAPSTLQQAEQMIQNPHMQQMNQQQNQGVQYPLQ